MTFKKYDKHRNEMRNSMTICRYRLRRAGCKKRAYFDLIDMKAVYAARKNDSSPSNDGSFIKYKIIVQLKGDNQRVALMETDSFDKISKHVLLIRKFFNCSDTSMTVYDETQGPNSRVPEMTFDLQYPTFREI